LAFKGLVLTCSVGISQFKIFLDSILSSPDTNRVTRQYAILRDFLASQTPKENDEQGLYLSGLFQAWSFASQTNNDNLVSAISTVLAQLLNTISAHIDFREHGVGICKSILKHDLANLVAGSLSAPKHKAYVISPALKLLTEVVSFDGGAVARLLYRQRDLTFDTQVLARNLSLKAAEKVVDDERQRPSIRSNAVRYLLANLKFQNESAKTDILKQSNVLRALFEGLQDDPPSLIIDILSSLKANVILDTALSRMTKGHVFNDRNLYNLSQLYRVDLMNDDLTEPKKPMNDIIHDFMLLVCTFPEAGVLRSSTGWYPPKDDSLVNEASEPGDKSRVDLGLEVLDSYGNIGRQVTLRNRVLGDFIHTLKPYKSSPERELVLAIFKAAPELVADYFSRKKKFPFDPKLTTTWIGYASVLFEIIQLPIPSFLGKKEGYSDAPPPWSVVVENILPQPLTQKVLTNCLNHSSDLIKFFGIRIITVAFQKLRGVLNVFHHAAVHASSLWNTASSKVLSEFCRRCPKMNDVVGTFRQIKKENMMHREAITRLISLYYEVTPQVALDRKFDISIALTNALQDMDKVDESHEDKGLRLLELEHLLRIARRSPGISWWKKPESLQHTPFLTLAKLAGMNLARSDAIGSSELEEILKSTVRECGLLDTARDYRALDVFLRSVGEAKDEKGVLEFLDDCLQRAARRPIKYEDDLDALVFRVHKKIPANKLRVSLLVMSLVEQWPFVEKVRKDALHEIAAWLRLFIFSLCQIGEDLDIHIALVDGLVLATSDKNAKNTLESTLTTFKDGRKICVPPETAEKSKPTTSTVEAVNGVSTTQVIPSTFSISNLQPPPENNKHTALTKWSTKDITTAIEEGHVSSLILLLSSTTLSIRRQSLTALRQFASKLRDSTYPERDQAYLLLGELIETATEPITTTTDQSLPHIATSFAARALSILTDPTHVLYAKMNAFLNRGPSWHVPRLASYWCAQILLHEPDDEAEGAHWREVVWLLCWLVDGVREAADVEVLRVGGVFERVLALFGHPSLTGYRRLEVDFEKVEMGGRSWQGKVKSLVMMLVGRVALVDGGATTMVTRAGILAWLDAVVVSGWVDEDGENVVKGIREAILERCDEARVKEWSSGMLTMETRS
jgi:nucleolar pre-ribosomal-associated protein 1